MYWRETLTIVLQDLNFFWRDLDFNLRDLDFVLWDLDFDFARSPVCFARSRLWFARSWSSPARPTHTLHSARRTACPCPPRERVCGLYPRRTNTHTHVRSLTLASGKERHKWRNAGLCPPREWVRGLQPHQILASTLLVSNVHVYTFHWTPVTHKCTHFIMS